MFPKLFHIYGPIDINSFSIAIAAGIFLFLKLASKYLNNSKIISKDDFTNLTIETAIVAILGGRVLHVLTDFSNYNSFIDIISIWNGGLSSFGSIISAIIYASYYLYKKNIAILPVLEIAAIHVPIIQSIGRVGCFLAGCCHGCSTGVAWAIKYTNPESAAPLNIFIHPTQLYSSIIFLLIFFSLKKLAKKNLPGGSMVMLYLIFSSLERIIVDFWRGDRVFLVDYNYKIFKILSHYQLIGLVILIIASFGLVYLNYPKRQNRSYESI